MTVEDILWEADRLGIREEVLKTTTYVREKHSKLPQLEVFELAFKEVLNKVANESR